MLTMANLTRVGLYGPATKYNFSIDITHGSLLRCRKGICNVIFPMKPTKHLHPTFKVAQYKDLLNIHRPTLNFSYLLNCWSIITNLVSLEREMKGLTNENKLLKLFKLVNYQ